MSTANGKVFRVALLGADGSRVDFDAHSDRSLLKCAAQAGIRLTSGCLQGRCAICRGRLLSGSVTNLRRASPNSVGAGPQRDDGTVLLCSVAATSDVEIAALSPWRRWAPL